MLYILVHSSLWKLFNKPMYMEEALSVFSEPLYWMGLSGWITELLYVEKFTFYSLFNIFNEHGE